MEMILQLLKKGIELFVSVAPLDFLGISGIKHSFVVSLLLFVSLTGRTGLSITLALTGYRIMWVLGMPYFSLVVIQGDP